MAKCPKFVTSEAKAKSFLRTKEVIDKFLNVLNLGEFRKLHTQLRQQAKDKYFSNNPSWNEKLFLEEKGGKKIVPNKVVFKQIDNINNIKYSLFVSEDGDVNVEKTVSALSEKFSIPYKIINDVNEKYSGKFEDGRVYINLAYVTPETAWHEFAHPFIEQVRDDNIVLYENLKKEITNTDYGQKVLQEVQKHYPELSLEEQIEEAIVETIARFVTGKIPDVEISNPKNTNLFSKLIDFINGIRAVIAKAVGKEFNQKNNIKFGTKSINYKDINIASLEDSFKLKHFAQMMQYGHRIELKEYIPLEGPAEEVSSLYEKFYDYMRNNREDALAWEKFVKNIELFNKPLPNINSLTGKGRDSFLNKLFEINQIFTSSQYSKLREKFPEFFKKENIQPLKTLVDNILKNEDGTTINTLTDDIKEKISNNWDEIVKDINAEEMITDPSQKYSVYLNSLFYKKSKLKQLKNQWKVSDFGGVYHHIGAYMNNAGAKNITGAIQLFIDLMGKNVPMELATYSEKSRSAPHGAIRISFKNETPVLESYLRDINSKLIDYKGQKKRVTNQGTGNVRLTLDDKVSGYDELFINATQNNIEYLEIKQDLSSEELGKLKELSDLTGAPIIQNGNMLYQPMTYRPYKPESLRYSKFQNEVKPGVKELFNFNSELSSIGTQEQYSQYLNSIFPNSQVKDIVYHFGGKPLSEFRKTNRGKGIYFTTDINGKYVFYPNNVTNKSEESRTTAIVNIKDVKYGESSKLFKTPTDKENFYYNKNELSKLQNNINELRNNNAPKSEINEAIELLNDFEPKPVNYQSINIFNNLANDDIDADGLLIQNPLGDVYTDEKFIVVFEPEQVHILGSKNDIDGFKKFVSSSPTKISSGPVKYSKFTNESQEKKIAGLTKKITTYLSNFGISVNDYSEIKENLNIDDFGFADVLSKIAHVSDPKQLPTIAGEFIAYMLQHRDVVKNVVTSFANANKELITTRNAIYYVASGLGKSELAKKNPNKFADMDELIANAVMEVYGEEYGTKENSKKIYEDELVQKALKNQIESVMKTKIILSPISPEKLKTIGFYYKKHYVPSEVNIDKILKGISSRTTNPYEVDRDTYKKIYVDPYFESKNVFTVEGYISDEFQDMNDLSQLLEEFLDRKDYTQGDNYSELDKQKYFKLIGELVGRELQKKEGINISKSLFEKIKEIIKRFYKLLTKNEVRGVNVNVGFIADAILENDKDFITASQFKPGAEGKPVSRVSVEKALATDSFGKIIVYTLAEEGFILTGSTALSEQGTILRPDENPLHDIDWVSPFSRADTTQKFFKHYPNAIKVRTIENETYLTDSYLIAPEGHYIANYQEIITSTGKVLIGSYDVMNTDGEVVGTYRLEKNEEGKLKEVEKNVKGKVIDFFIYPDYNVRNKYKPFEYTSDEGANIKLANWRDIFAAKLEWSRLKDVWDYNRFIPFEQQESLSLQIDKLIQKGIVKAKCN